MRLIISNIPPQIYGGFLAKRTWLYLWANVGKVVRQDYARDQSWDVKSLGKTGKEDMVSTVRSMKLTFYNMWILNLCNTNTPYVIKDLSRKSERKRLLV